MKSVMSKYNPDVVVCPFLKQKIPESIWSSIPCLIVHPGIQGDRGAASLDWAIKKQQSEWGVTLLQAEDEMD